MDNIPNSKEYRMLLARSVWFYFMGVIIGIWAVAILLVESLVQPEGRNLFLLLATITILSMFLLYFRPYWKDLRSEFLCSHDIVIHELLKQNVGSYGYPGYYYKIKSDLERYLRIYDKQRAESLRMGHTYRVVYGESSGLVLKITFLE